MSERQSDFERLRAFVLTSDQQSFAALARQHLDLVYGTAVRKVGDPGAAEEIAQNVFITLSKKAWQFAADDSLPAWLHRAALLESKEWLRGELRRRRREHAAVELGTTMNPPDEQPALRSLIPLVDEALLSLREADRVALLLRYYEGRSLRDVGQSFGISEEAARKRVGSSLEKFARFFQRRGFRSATPAVAAVALQQTASQASAAAAAAVANAVLQAAPPSGVAAWLGWTAGLTKAKTAMLCLALLAAPAGWKWREGRATAREAAKLESQAAAAREQVDRLSSEIGTLRTRLLRAETSLSDANEAVAKNAEIMRKLDFFKARLHGLLTGTDHRWPEDLPFIRVPKKVLEALRVHLSWSPGVVDAVPRDLLGISAEERQRIESALKDYLAKVDHGFQSSLYETNQPSRGSVPADAVAAKVFVVPALGQDVAAAKDFMLDELQQTLGEERWALLKQDLQFDGGTHSTRRVMNLDAAGSAQEVVAWVKQGENGAAFAGYTWNGGSSPFGSDHIALSDFRPENLQNSWGASGLHGSQFPEALLNKITTWFTEESLKRTSKP